MKSSQKEFAFSYRRREARSKLRQATQDSAALSHHNPRYRYSSLKQPQTLILGTVNTY